MRKFFIGLIITLLVSACADHNVIIDTQGVNMARYQTDLKDCQNFTKQVNSKVATGAAAGAVVGGAIGVIVGTTKKLAGAGAVSGAAKGAYRTEHEKAQVVRRCLQGRGYRVLN